MLKGELKEAGGQKEGGKELRKETSYVMYPNQHPQMIVKCMY